MNLNIGDTIGIIALSGDCEQDKVNKSKVYLERLGYKIKLSKNIYDCDRYLAGSDDDKVLELHNFYKDSEIKLILCARGGYGNLRLINKIDYEIIKNNPKPMCGYSDSTILLLMIYKMTGIINYHSPMACSDFSDDISIYTSDNFFKALNCESLTYKGEYIYSHGNAQGVLFGGNLASIVSLCGQDFLPDKDFIFFAEDINEPVYKIDKMFQQLININKFKNKCKGIILGDFIGVDNIEWLDSYFNELAITLKVPISSGFKITHNKDKITLPIGKFARLSDNILHVI